MIAPSAVPNSLSRTASGASAVQATVAAPGKKAVPPTKPTTSTLANTFAQKNGATAQKSGEIKRGEQPVPSPLSEAAAQASSTLAYKSDSIN